jgi:hypothetical protein
LFSLSSSEDFAASASQNTPQFWNLTISDAIYSRLLLFAGHVKRSHLPESEDDFVRDHSESRIFMLFVPKARSPQRPSQLDSYRVKGTHSQSRFVSLEQVSRSRLVTHIHPSDSLRSKLTDASLLMNVKIGFVRDSLPSADPSRGIVPISRIGKRTNC